ncbi:MAG: PA0069 family radical SAM protein [Gammaproteobacteria bacterium]
MSEIPAGKAKGRGTVSSVQPRYLENSRESIDDGWYGKEEAVPLATTVTLEKARTIITRNQSPDIPFEHSINPYRGCEHGCIYCYARPTHAYLDLSPGIDFETKLFAKTNAPGLLQKELGKPGYRCRTIAFGTNTDPYQPIERRYCIMRRLIELLSDCRHPLSIVTKSSLVERDRDLLAPMAEQGLVKVFLSITTLDNSLARRMEPRSGAPQRRLQTLSRLSAAGIPTGVLFAPVIPGLNDTEMESILEKSAAAGAESAGYVMLRLPREIKQLFQEWLERHEPLKAKHVMNMIRDIRDGKDNDPAFYSRMRGSGVYAQMIRRRFEHTCKKAGLNGKERQLVTERFKPPPMPGGQQSLF